MLDRVFRWLGAISDRQSLRGGGSQTHRSPDFLPLLRHHQLKTIFWLTPVMMVANMINVTAFTVLEVHLGRMSISDWVWVSIMAVLATTEFVRTKRTKARNKHNRASARGVGKVVVTSITLGLLWCYPLNVIAFGGTTEEIAFVSALTAGMLAGGAIALYPVPLAALSYVGVLTIAMPPALFLGMPSMALPFSAVTIMFFAVIIVSVHRHHRSFVREFSRRLKAEFQKELLDLLIGNDQARFDNCIWQSDEVLSLITSAEPIHRILGLPGSDGNDLPALIAASGHRATSRHDREMLDRLLGLNGPYPDEFCVRVSRTEPGEGPRTLEIAGRRADLDQSGGAYYNGYVKDVSEEVMALAEAHRLATHDNMTSLPNHREFLRQVEAITAERLEWQSSFHVGVCFVDADNLKRTNDSFGHRAGDALLVAISERLLQLELACKVLCRKGGDEYLIFYTCDTADEFAAATQRLHARLNGSFEFEGRVMPLQCTIGASSCTVGEKNIQQLEFEADVALKNQKKIRKSSIGFYEETVGAAHRRDAIVARDLRGAIRSDALRLDYQPIVNADGTRIWAVEALLRWDHPELGQINPQKIVEMAAYAGCSGDLTEWVLQRALREGQAWPRDIEISINVSASEFDRPDLTALVARVLNAENTAPERLWLEITEDQFLPRSTRVAENIKGLRSLGVKLAIDDFGSGYSCLSSLDDIECDVIKIDRSLVQNCHLRPTSLTLIVSLCAIARANERVVVVEGVEVAEEADALGLARVDHFQGFLFHRPMPADKLTDLVATKSKKNSDAA
ncbi:hypothetical protein A9Q95_00675 [Rhodobacterales bacterium 59_46_T64]|nr:hypothetical protein A9Q95_00675 [Rhodobacterales bacterium 59_46_T64]